MLFLLLTTELQVILLKPDFKKHVFKIDEFHANVKLKSNVKNLATNLQLKDTELKPILTDKRWFEIWKVTNEFKRIKYDFKR